MFLTKIKCAAAACMTLAVLSERRRLVATSAVAARRIALSTLAERVAGKGVGQGERNAKFVAVDAAMSALYEALAVVAHMKVFLGLADTFEVIATRAAHNESYREAARLLGTAGAMRGRTGEARFKVYDAAFESAVGVLRGALGDDQFDAAWAEGAALSTEEAIAYAQRGRGERKRPSSGWASLTPMERDVVRLVSDGLGNKDIAARLFVSHRTVQTHLTHVYTKLGLTSRVQLAQEAARHS